MSASCRTAFVAVARNIRAWRGEARLQADRVAQRDERGAQVLDIMERRLATAPWLATGHPTIAHLALFAHTHRADEAGVDLTRWPAIRAWIDRVAAIPAITTLPRPPPA